jgi:DNA-binding transcriptional LysR family regulator
MNDRQLRYILTISEKGNITAAAQKLFISQPSLSYLLSHVEAELGIKLFDRSITPLALTDAGECYIEAAKQILNIHRKLKNQIEDIQHLRKGRLTIGCSPQLSSIFFPAFLPTFIKKNPGIQVNLVEENLLALEELLASGDIEIAFTNAVINNKAFGHVPLFNDELLLMAPNSFTPSKIEMSQKSNFPIINLSCLEDCSFVLLKPKHRIRQMIDRIFNDCDFQPNIILETSNWETCYSMVAEGLAFTILPNLPLKRLHWPDQMVKQYGLSYNNHRQHSIYYRKNSSHPELIESFISLVQSILK